MQKLTFLTAAEAANLKGVAVTQLREWIWSSRLPAEKVNGRWLITESDLARFQKVAGVWMLIDSAGDTLLTIDETAKRFNVTGQTVRTWIQQGQIPGEKISGRHFVKQADLEAMDIHSTTDAGARPLPDILREKEIAAEVRWRTAEMSRKLQVAQSEERITLDQSTRLRALISEQVRFLKQLLQGYELSHGQVARQISALKGAIEYQGRDQAPLDSPLMGVEACGHSGLKPPPKRARAAS